MSLITVNDDGLHILINCDPVDFVDMGSMELLDTLLHSYASRFATQQYKMSVSGAMRWPDGFHKEVMINLLTLEML
jgi:hypothetical protein